MSTEMYETATTRFILKIEAERDDARREREEALQEAGRLRARVEELEALPDPVITLAEADDRRGFVVLIDGEPVGQPVTYDDFGWSGIDAAKALVVGRGRGLRRRGDGGMTDLGRQIGERAQAAAEPTLLDLVRQYGAACMAAEQVAGTGVGVARLSEAHALFARIAALVPTLPVQARDYYGVPLWIHGCGEVRRQKEVPTRRCDCFNPDGPWRQLLVAPDAAPDGDRAPDTGCEVGADGVTCIVADRAHRDAQHSGSTLGDVATLLNGEGDNWLDNPGERREQRNAPERICPDDRDHNPHRLSTMREQRMQELAAAEITLREVMAALGVDRAEDVLSAIRRVQRRQVEAVQAMNKVRQQRDELAELIRATMAAPDGRIVLRLPEVPPGTVALTGVNGDRYRWLDDGSDQWEAIDPRPEWRGQLGALLDREGTSVTVELAPEPEPQQPPTAAEVWRGLSDADQRGMRAAGYATLAEALDREAGL